MAGIGFRLREIVTRKTFTEWAHLYLYSAIVFAGPWLFSIICLAALSVFALPDIESEGVALFTVTVVYCYAFSLISTGLLQLPITRYVADRLYLKDHSAILPSFVSSTVVVATVQAFLAALFLAFCDLSLTYKVWATSLYVSISVIWMAMIYLTAAKDYNAIVGGFFVGYLVSFVLGKLLARYLGTEGLLSGFLAGQVVLLFWLIWRIFEEFPNDQPFNFRFKEAFEQYPSLMWSGLLYSAAIWVDKFVYWFGPSGIRVHSLFYTHFPYDSAMFFAYLSIVPTLAMFLVRIETEFYTRYKAYYGGILSKDSLGHIEQKKAAIIDTLRKSLGSVIIYQGVVTLATVLLLPVLLDLLGVAQEHLPVFRIAALGAVFHVLVLVLMIVLLYFDFRGATLIVSGFFFFSNLALSWWSVNLAPWAYGWGYLISTALTLFVALVLLWNRLSNLEYLTFMRQPIHQQKVVVR